MPGRENPVKTALFEGVNNAEAPISASFPGEHFCLAEGAASGSGSCLRTAQVGVNEEESRTLPPPPLSTPEDRSKKSPSAFLPQSMCIIHLTS